MTTILAVVSDLHTNSTIGLCPPTIQLDDGGTYKSSKAQRWLWRNWQHYIAKVQATSEKHHNAPIITIFNGDIHDGDHHDTPQIITRNPATMQTIAWKTIEPLVNISQQTFVIRGTESHVGKSAAFEEALATDIESIKCPDTDTHSWWQLLLQVERVRLDIAHHGRLGRLPWTRPNSLNRLIAETTMYYTENGDTPPDIIIRSHLHQYADTGQNYRHTRAISTPAWQLATAYVQRLSPGALADIGGLIIICDNGRYTIEVIRYYPDKRRPYRLKKSK